MQMVAETGTRQDGRGTTDVRDIDIRMACLPKMVHGSALFTRGETQSLGALHGALHSAFHGAFHGDITRAPLCVACAPPERSAPTPLMPRSDHHARRRFYVRTR